MNKTTIFLIVIIVLILALGYMVWQHNKLWKIQTDLNKTQFEINDALRKKFPEIPENSPQAKESKEDLSEKIKASTKELAEKTEALLENTSDDLEQDIGKQSVSNESEENPATAEQILNFAQMIRAGKDQLTDADEIQFYKNNTPAIEDVLRKLAKQETPSGEVKKTKRGRHPDDCQCMKCSLKRKPSESITEA